MNRINLYVFIQIFKSCTLVFFIFLSIAWLLQFSRLFAYLSNLKIDFSKILFLSSYIIPNLINITLPFVLIFGLVLTFIKLDKDKEIIAIYSLGLGVRQINKPLILISILTVLFYLFFNFFLSPFLYEKYKKKEHDLRNLININDINFSNFIELDKNLIIDFSKKNNLFSEIFINYKNLEGDNTIFAKTGKIKRQEDHYIFDLNNGYKLNIYNESLEKLEFENYKIKFPVKKESIYNNYDKNTLTIFDLLKEKDKKKILEKLIDTLLIILIIIFFYFNIIKKNNYKINNILIFIVISIVILITHNVIKNIEINFNQLFVLYNINLIFFLLIVFYLGKKES